MEYIKNMLDFHISEPAAVSLGKFDGLHLGHKYLIRELEKSRAMGYKSVIFTFDVPPRSLKDNNYKVLLTNREKEQIFAEAGIDYVIECPFTEEFKNMTPGEFLEMLTEKIPVREIVAGTDFRFGKNRSGGPDELLRYEKKLGYRAVIVDKMQYGGEDVSSTRIRSEIAKGRMEEANALLGYPYFLDAPVVHGNELGRTLGFPTVNQRPSREKLLPPNGVYVSLVTVGGETFYGVTNIGNKPTIGGGYPTGVETYIFDFDRQIYDREIRVSFLSFLRPELKFFSVEELRTQIERDRREALEYGRNHRESGNCRNGNNIVSMKNI
ncbi:MAG: bifunctional riboflavin kinase/FAD synthetase [Clostridiales bacterium]|nr:bifunctional riboflavin kinase/FAD synthetase [Clostridiales bacterium]